MNKFYTLLTKLGEELIAQAGASQLPLKIMNMALGDGNGQLPTPSIEQTSLIKEVYRANLNSLEIDDKNKNHIIAELIIPETVGGFWIREVGLFDEEDRLIAVGNLPETYKPKLIEGSGKIQSIRMILIVKHTENIELKIEPSAIVATRQYVDEAITAHTKTINHPSATITQKGFVQLNSAVNSTSESHAATPLAVKKIADASLQKTGGTMTGPLTMQSNGYPTINIKGSNYNHIFQGNPGGDLIFYLQGANGSPATRLKWLKSVDKWSFEYCGVDVKGKLNAYSGLTSYAPNGIRVVFGGYGSLLLNDGIVTCLGVTDKGNEHGAISSKLRPLVINNETGDMESWHSLTVAKNLVAFGDVIGNKVYDSGHRVYSPSNPPPSQYIVGEYKEFLFRPNQLPPKWYFLNGHLFDINSPQGQVLKSFTQEFKSDWGIVEKNGKINLPNFFDGQGKGYVTRPVNNAARTVGTKEEDAIRNIVGKTGTGSINFSNISDGVFKKSYVDHTQQRHPNVDAGGQWTIVFDASTVVPTADENRMKNIGVSPAIYLGV